MKKRTLFFCMAFFLIIFSGCEYDFVLPEEAPVINEPISFSSQVVPIFSDGGKCTSCHKPGGASPDLTLANAYDELVPGFVNTGTPEQSGILTIPGSSEHSWKKFSAAESAVILAWIKQGVKNN